MSKARVYYVPAGEDFSSAVLEGLNARLPQDNPALKMAQTRLWVNTRRAARLMEDRLKRAEPAIQLLPQIGVIGEGLPTPEGLPDAIAPLRRQFILARLTGALLDNQQGLAADTAAFDMAGSLAALLDELDEHGIDRAALSTLDVGDFAKQWELSADFLEIIQTAWPMMLAEETPALMDPAARLDRQINAQINQWQDTPAQHPIVIAGSTGSRAGTRKLMQAVAQQPEGAVILPGFDPHLSPDLWEAGALPAEHPQAGMVGFCRSLGLTASDILPWVTASSTVQSPRARFVSTALLPAPVTDLWMDAAQSLEDCATEGLAGLSILEAPGPREEALGVAWAIRAQIETQKHVALVTPDRTLARRVASELGRWGILPDDSAGRPLHLTPPGVFLGLVLNLAQSQLSPVDLIAVLKHPLCGGTGPARGEHLRRTRRLEIGLLRDGRLTVVTREALMEWAEQEADPKRAEHQDKDAPQWVEWLATLLENVAPPDDMDLSARIQHHFDATIALSTGLLDDGTCPLFDEAAGEKLAELKQTLEDHAQVAGPTGFGEYRVILHRLLSASNVTQEAARVDGRVSIWGPLEARMQSADLVILGGANEGIWPAQAQPDPWLNRPMRAQIGLPPPERSTGLAAHDFQNALNQQRVIVSRALKQDGVPTVPSRWLNRLVNLAQGVGPAGKSALEAAQASGKVILDEALALTPPPAPVAPEKRPAPVPPVHARPEKLSVTQIETLVRDPFSIYARKVLGLREMNPLGVRPLADDGKSANAGLRGTLIHAVMEDFARALMQDGWPDDPQDHLFQLAQNRLDTHIPWPAIRAEWLAWFKNLIPQLVDAEAAMRQNGQPLAVETDGQMRLDDFDFTLTARADRIDLYQNTALAIYDYKTGTLPSQKQIGAFYKQLHLEGAIAQAGGFKGIAATKVAHLGLVGLKNLDKPPPVLSVEDIASIRDELHRLIAAISAGGFGYVARARPALQMAYHSTYDALSRYGEWDDSDNPVREPVGRDPA